jgi:hypothetical protein
MKFSVFNPHLNTELEGVLITYKLIIRFIDPCASSVEIVS